MKIQTGGQYIESLRKIRPKIYYREKRIEDVTRHPATAPHVRAAAMTYALVNDAEIRDLARIRNEFSQSGVHHTLKRLRK
jgi:4-hydroxybutyryl-CoA dehydratase/vinylacetyl-CoA-Delta-isomerase